jgi:hypothetical protein
MSLKRKPKFTEPPPDIKDPSWPRKFQDWWWRKCAHYGLDPVETMANLLSDDPKIRMTYRRSIARLAESAERAGRKGRCDELPLRPTNFTTGCRERQRLGHIGRATRASGFPITKPRTSCGYFSVKKGKAVCA